ncbi:prepilin peptidase [Nesterenkonia natronophila]|uniref:prepilin peptidase n=1 Tax=Nesterenkonia natronophila TaxID=2174932 RepID=UPI0013142C90|nr:A24 family peptidase [Nesterenkonia natronophila]
MVSYIGELLTAGSPAQLVAGLLLVVAGLSFAVCGTALAIIDAQQHRLPNRIVYPWSGFTVGLLVLVTFLLSDAASLGRAVAAGLAWGTLFLAVTVIHPPAIGMGDVKLAVVLGLYTGFFGWEVFAVGVALSFLLGGLVSVGLLVTQQVSSSTKIAFGPFLILGSAAALMLS